MRSKQEIKDKINEIEQDLSNVRSSGDESNNHILEAWEAFSVVSIRSLKWVLQ